MSKNDLELIELSIEEAQKNINKFEALKRLRTNKDFKDIIEIGFLESEAVRAVHAKADPALQSPEAQQAVSNMIIAVGYFTRYLNYIMAEGENSVRAIDEHRKTRDEIMSEVE